MVVELTLFCNWYDDNQWHLSPLYARNNVNGVGDRDSKQVNSLRSGDVLKHQEAMVRKVVAEVNDLDNVFFEVCNEPGAEGDWMDRMAEVIWEAEGKLPNRHLIANNGHPVPHMAIFNAHYDRDGSFVRGNYGRNLVVGYDETGFDGASDLPYRRQGWHFLLSGGGLYDNLDWSFSVAHPDGSETKWDKKLGGGSPALRRQLGILLAFLEGFDLARLKPDKGVVKGGAAGQLQRPGRAGQAVRDLPRRRRPRRAAGGPAGRRLRGGVDRHQDRREGQGRGRVGRRCPDAEVARRMPRISPCESSGRVLPPEAGSSQRWASPGGDQSLAGLPVGDRHGDGALVHVQPDEGCHYPRG